RGEPPGLGHPPQERSGTHHRFLPDKLVQGAGAHARRQGRLGECLLPPRRFKEVHARHLPAKRKPRHAAGAGPLMNLLSRRWVPPCPSATSPSSGGHVHREAESGLPRVGVLAHNNGQLHHAHSRGSVFTFSAPRSYHAPAGRIKTRTGPFLPAFATAGERQQLPPDPP